MIKIKQFIVVAVMIVTLAGCHISYTLNGAAIDYNVYKTTRLGETPIPSATVYPP